MAPAGSETPLHMHVERAFKIASGLQKEGREPEADGLYQFILAVAPTHYEALFRLGSLRARANQMDDAVRLFGRAVAAKPLSADALGALGMALSAQDRKDEALACFQKALSINPACAWVLNACGAELHKSGRTEEAMAQFERAVAIEPDHADANFNLANVLQCRDRLQEAMVHYGKVLAAQPHNYAAFNNVAAILKKLGRFDEAIAFYRRALVINPKYPDAYYNLGTVYLALDRYEDAIEQSEKALRLDPSMALAHNNIGVALQALGRVEESGRTYEKALQLAPRQATIHLNLAYLRRFTPGDPRMAALETLAEDTAALDTDNQIALHFALGKAFSDLGRHERSFRHLRDGNALKRAHLAYDEKETLSLFERIRATFTPELIRQKSGGGDPSKAPVFVVGMPRSGTTLVEQILASHSGVYGAGEIETFYQALVRLIHRNGISTAFPDMVPGVSADAMRDLGSDYVRSIRVATLAAARIVNKLPLNFKYVGLIHLALPNARIVHVRRDPVDTCFSCFSLLFSGNQPFAYDQGELARYYRGYAALMAHWRDVLPPGVMIEVQYEDLVADLERQARTIIDHCGLRWEDACLAFHDTERPVKTASSVQVRRPVYRTSIGRWRPYETFLQPLIQALDAGMPDETGTRQTGSLTCQTLLRATGG